MKFKGPIGLASFFAFGLIALLGIPAPPASAADPCPNAQYRVGASANLPDCRAYEQVTPVDKNGAEVFYTLQTKFANPLVGLRGEVFPPVQYAVSGAKGGRFAFVAPAGIGDTDSAPWTSQYVATRGGDGWSSVAINPPFEQTQPGISSRFPLYQAFSPNLDRAIFRIASSGRSLAPNDFPLEDQLTSNYYVRDTATGGLTTLVPETGAFNAVVHDVNEEATSVLVRTDFEFNLYQGYIDENGEGKRRLVSLDVNDQPVYASAGGQANLFNTFNSYFATDRQLTEGAQSQDGKRFLFNDGQGQCRGEAAFELVFYAFDCDNNNILLRDMGLGETRKVNAPDSGIEDLDPGPGTLAWGGSKDLSKVFFTSQEKLTANATAGWDPEACESTGGTGNCYTGIGSFGDLYRYDWDGNGGDGRLEDITVDPGGSDGAEVLGVLGFSDDGDRAYFVARSNRLDGGQGVDGEANLYSWHANGGDPETTFVATLEPMQPGDGMGCCASDYGDLGDALNWTMSGYERSSKLTRDGEHLVFVSKNQLDPEFDNDGYAQVYVYDAVAGELRCASCFGQEPPRHDSYLTAGEMIPTALQHKRVQSISDDGRFVFFNAGGSLDKRDSNGRTDVYRFDGEAGDVALVSDGMSASDSYFVDASESGGEAYFSTRSRLAPTDIDTNIDIYVARVGGGFARKAPPPGCEGDACQPPPATPRETTPGSASFAGPGSRPPRRAKSKLRKCGKNQRRVRSGGKARCVKKKAGTKNRKQTGKGRSGK